MDKIVEKQYSVIKILEDYKAWLEYSELDKYKNLNYAAKDDKRLEWDNDAKYFHKEKKLEKEDALLADTIFSFWTPYKRLLKLEANWDAYKTVRSISALLKQIKNPIENDYTKKIIGLNEKIEPFAKLIYTKENYMLLPKREMNNLRYKITEDRIDMTLYECFEKGALSKFFADEKDLVKWIINQNLDCCFGEKISQNEIKWLIDEKHPKWISEMDKDEIYNYLKQAISIIEKRNKI